MKTKEEIKAMIMKGIDYEKEIKVGGKYSADTRLSYALDGAKIMEEYFLKAAEAVDIDTVLVKYGYADFVGCTPKSDLYNVIKEHTALCVAKVSAENDNEIERLNELLKHHIATIQDNFRIHEDKMAEKDKEISILKDKLNKDFKQQIIDLIQRELTIF